MLNQFCEKCILSDCWISKICLIFLFLGQRYSYDFWKQTSFAPILHRRLCEKHLYLYLFIYTRWRILRSRLNLVKEFYLILVCVLFFFCLWHNTRSNVGSEFSQRPSRRHKSFGVQSPNSTRRLFVVCCLFWFFPFRLLCGFAPWRIRYNTRTRRGKTCPPVPSSYYYNYILILFNSSIEWHTFSRLPNFIRPSFLRLNIMKFYNLIISYSQYFVNT